jgi:hypothetical protein
MIRKEGVVFVFKFVRTGRHRESLTSGPTRIVLEGYRETQGCRTAYRLQKLSRYRLTWCMSTNRWDRCEHKELRKWRFRGEANSSDLARDGKNPFSHCVLIFVGRGPEDRSPTRQSDTLGHVLCHIIHVVTNWKVLEGGREGRNGTRALTDVRRSTYNFVVVPHVRRKRIRARDSGRLATSSNRNGNRLH